MSAPSPTNPGPTDNELADLSRQVRRAIRTGEESDLHIMGYGEISCVVQQQSAGVDYACKLLPRFASRAAFDDYGEVVNRYVTELRTRGIPVVATAVRWVAPTAEPPSAWCVQPMLEANELLVPALRGASIDVARERLGELFKRIAAAARDGLGLDGQASNWGWTANGPVYFDVTTPLLRDSQGNERLDTDLFVGALPWVARKPVARFVLRGILDHYYAPRDIFLDLLGNLHKENLSHLVPLLLPLANEHLSAADLPLSVTAVRRYYSQDATTWEWLLRARRADRWWQRTIRRRDYPYLLPGKVDRHV